MHEKTDCQAQQARVNTRAVSLQTWDFAADFSVLQNPDGAWSFGSARTADGAAAAGAAGTAGAAGMAGSPDMTVAEKVMATVSYEPLVMWGPVVKNTGVAPLSWYGGIGGLPCWEAGQAGLEAGRTPAIVRWTSPFDGWIAVRVRFTGQRTTGTHAEVASSLNGRVLFLGEVRGFCGHQARQFSDRTGSQPEQEFGATLEVFRGDQLDFSGRCLEPEKYIMPPPLRGASVGLDAVISRIGAPGHLIGKVQAVFADSPALPESGSGIPGITVKAGGTQVSCLTDDAGTYALNLPEGEYTMQIAGQGYILSASPTILLQAGRTVRQDFAVTGAGAIRGQIRETGSFKQLNGVCVRLESLAEGEAHGTGRLDEAGKAYETASRDGLYWLIAPAGQYLLKASLLHHGLLEKSITIQAGQVAALDLELLPGTLYPWPEYGHSAGHQGYTESPGPMAGSLLWKYTTSTRVDLSSPVCCEEKIIAGALDGKVYALDEQTGRLIWQFQTGGDVWSSPAVQDELVYIGSNDGFLYALEVSSGQVRWRFAARGAIMANPAISGEMVVFSSQDGSVYALDSDCGAVIWQHDLSEGEKSGILSLAVWSSPAIAGNKVFISCGNGQACAFDLKTGQPLWQTQTAALTYISSPVYDDGRIYVAAHCGWEMNRVVMGLFYGLDAVTGKILWTFQTGAWLYADPVVSGGKVYLSCGDQHVYILDGASGRQLARYFSEAEHFNSPGVHDGVIYIAANYGHIQAIDEATGKCRWRKAKNPSVSSAPLILGGRMFMSGSDSFISAIDLGTGEYVWQYKTDGWVFPYPGVFSSPAVSGGLLYTGSNDARLYAIDAQNGRPAWSFKTGGAIMSALLVAGGAVYATSMDGLLYAVDSASGRLIWSTRVCRDPWAFDIPTLITPTWSSPLIAGRRLFIGSPDGGIFAIDPENGRIIWEYRVQSALTGSPLVVDGTLYIAAAGDGFIYALDAATGAEIRRYDIGLIMFGSLTCAFGNLYVPCLDGRCRAVDLKTGEVAWDVNTYTFAPFGIAGRTVYIGDNNCRMNALDALNGRIIWSVPLMSGVWSCPAITREAVYVTSNDSHLYCLRRDTGEIVWDFRTGHELFGSAAVADGIVYFGSADGNIYAIGKTEEDGL